VFEDQLVFDELFEAAEEELLSAKNSGRNRTALRVISPSRNDRDRGGARA
jgi:hypothetical protein